MISGPLPPGDLASAYAESLEKKAMWLARLLSDAGLDLPAPVIRPTPVKKGFRTRIQWKIFPDGGEPCVEGRDPRRGRVPAEETFWLLPPEARRQAQAVVAVLRGAYSECAVDGCELRLEHGGPGVHVTLNIKRSRAVETGAVLEGLHQAVPGLIGVVIPSQKRTLGGRHLRHRLPAGTFTAGAMSFFQTNCRLLPEILDEAGTRLHPLASGSILDLFCGVGLMSLSLGKRKARILGVDSNPGAIDDARGNAAAQGFADVEFTAERAERFLERGGGAGSELILLNPSRSGCPPSVIAAAVAIGPHTAAMISCNPETAVRDLKRWGANGFRIASLSAYDMFPFSPFLETLTVLTRG